MTTKHTPGPWRVDTGQLVNCGPTSRYLYVSAHGKSLCNFLHDHPSDSDVANFNLIAAAPELLEALKDARRYVADYACDNPNHPTLAKVDAAIAKAEGERTA